MNAKKSTKKIIVANWKMNPTTIIEARSLVAGYLKSVSGNIQLMVCPPSIFLADLISVYGDKAVFGAQNCFWENTGAYTGELSPTSLKAVGAKYVLLGHSERRKYFGEDDNSVVKKIQATSQAGLTPMICLGGGQFTPASQNTIRKSIHEQIIKMFPKNKIKRKNYIFVYEPAWAISTLSAKPVTPKEAEEMMEFIRSTAKKFAGVSSFSVIYGGSVNKDNAADYLSRPGIDGALVGAASLRQKDFSSILSS